MTIAAFPGPVVSCAENPNTSGPPNGNPQAGPSMSLQGYALLDMRTPYTYQEGAPESTKVYGHIATRCVAIDQVPSAIAANNIAASQSPGTSALTLVSSSGAGITVGASVYSPTSSATVTGLLAIDTAMAGVSGGTSGTITMWSPATSVSRNVRITSGGNDSGITFLVVGYDIYGYRMTERITGANAGVASGAKAFKYILSITPSASVASTVTVGTGDVYGFPLRADTFGYVDITWNNAKITANTGFTAAVTTDPATATTGDVRGTYAVQSASDGTKRLTIFITQQVSQMVNSTLSSTFTGPYGVTQA